jgi:hypothetical protein
MKVKLPAFYIGKSNCDHKFTWIFHTCFELWGYFCTKSPSFSTYFATMGKTLYISVVKFPASTSEHINKTLNSLSSAKLRQLCVSLTRPNRWQSDGARYGLWAGWGTTVHHIFAVATRAFKLVWGWALSFRSGRTLPMRCRGLFKVSLNRLWCAAKWRQRILGWYTAS